jgi:hypothetical protein
MSDPSSIRQLLKNLNDSAAKIKGFGWTAPPGWQLDPQWRSLPEAKDEASTAARQAAVTALLQNWNAESQAKLLADFVADVRALSCDVAAVLRNHAKDFDNPSAACAVSDLFGLAAEGNLPALIKKLKAIAAPGLVAMSVRQAGIFLEKEAERLGREWLSRAATSQSTGAKANGDGLPVIPGEIELIPGGFIYRGVQMDLSGKPWEVLKALVESRLKRLSSQQLLKTIWWEDSMNASDQNVKDAVSEARTVLQAAMRKAGVRKPKDPLRCVDKGSNLAWALELEQV